MAKKDIKFPKGIGIIVTNGPIMNFNLNKKAYCTFDLVFVTEPWKLDEKDELGEPCDISYDNVLIILHCLLNSVGGNIYKAEINANNKYYGKKYQDEDEAEKIGEEFEGYVKLIVDSLNNECEVKELMKDTTIDKLSGEIKEIFDNDSEDDYLEYFIFKKEGETIFSNKEKKLISKTERLLFDVSPEVKEFYKVTKTKIKIPEGVPYLKAKGENNFLLNILMNDDTYSYIEIETDDNFEENKPSKKRFHRRIKGD